MALGISTPQEGIFDLDSTPDNTSAPLNIEGANKPLLSEPVVKERAEKANFGLKDASPGVETLTAALQRGDEKAVREQAATNVALKEREKKQKIIEGLLASNPGNTSPELIELIQGLSMEELQNPDTIFETEYGKEYVNKVALGKKSNESVFNRQLVNNPADTLDTMDFASSHIARGEMARTKLQDLKARWDDMSIFSKGVDFVGTMIPLRSWANIANSGAKFSDGIQDSLPGDTIANKVRYLWTLEPQAFNKALTETVDKLAETSMVDAMQFVQAVNGYSSSEEFLGNAFGVLDLFDVGTMASLGFKSAKIAKGAASEVPKLAGKTAPRVAVQTETAEARTTRLEKEAHGQTLRDQYPGADNLDKALEPEVRKALEVATGPTGVTAEKAAPAMVAAIKAGRSDIADELIARMERSYEGMNLEPGVPKDSPKYNVIKEDLAKRKETAKTELDQIKRLRTLREKEEGVVPPLSPGQMQQGAASTIPEVQVRKALRDATKAAAEVPTRPERVTEIVGETEKAAAIKAVQSRIAEQTNQELKGAAEKFRGFENLAPSITNPTKVLADPGSLTREAASRLAAKLEYSADRLADSVTTPVMGERLSTAALTRAAENAKEELLLEYFHLNDSIMDVARNARNTVTTTDSVSLRLGDTQAQPLDSYEKTKVFADLYGLPEGSWRPMQEGGNFWIDIPRAINEKTGDVQKLLLTEGNANPESNPFATMFLNRIRSPAEVTSEQGRANRNVAALGQAQFNRVLETAAEDFTRIPKANREQFEDILRANRDNPSPLNPTERGRYYETVGELDEAYMARFNRLPTEAETHAYFQYVQLNDLDLMIRNSLMLNGKERMGIKKYSFETQANHYAEYEAPKVKTASFEGVPAKEIPWGSDHLTVVMYDPGVNSFTMARRGAAVETREMMNRALKEEGYSLVRVSDPLKRPLKEAINSNDVVEYVLTKKFDTAPLDLQQINRRPGGHVIYKHDWWVKQPKLYTTEGGVRYYEGDVTAFNFVSEQQAKKMAPRLEEARKLLNNKQALDDYALHNLPWDGDQVRKLFADDGPFSPDQPFFVARSGQKYSDLSVFDRRVRDLSSGDYSLTSDLESAFTQHRDWNAMTIKNVGTESNPVFNLAQAELLDPSPTLARSLGQVSRSRFFNDMKVNAAETFAQQYGDTLKGVDMKDLLQRPAYYLKEAPNLWNPNADPLRLAEAKVMQRNAMQFIGQQTPFGKQMDWVKAKLVNGVENIMGEGAASWLSTTKLMNGADPTSTFRGIAFHTKLGLFSIPQLFIQAQGLANVALIAPRSAPQAMAGYSLMRTLMVNSSEEMLNAAAKKAGKLGWRPEDFKEAWVAMERSGWNNVGKESAFWDDISDPSLYRSSAGTILNAGAVFFNEGERMVRMSAWNVAYLEWRRANPTVALRDREIGQILNRADTLSGNMTRASKASWEQGIWSIPAQFSSYTARLLDQFWGRQLTVGEKARLFGGMGLLYGAPVAGGAATGIPFYEMWKQSAIDNGITDSDKFASLFYEGGVSMLLSAITGQDYNVAQRYGPGGFQLIRDLLTGDKGFLEAITGPSGGMVTDAYKSVIPLIGDLQEVYKTGGSFEPTIADLIDATRQISSVNATLKTMTALQTGKYITKNEVYMSDMNSWDTVFSQITGMTPREVTDAMLMKQSLKDLNKLQDEAEKNFTKYIKRGLNEQANGNRTAAESFYRRARSFLIVGGFQPDRYADLLQKALGNQGSVIDRIGTQYWKKAPPAEQQQRMKQIQDMLKNRQERNSK